MKVLLLAAVCSILSARDVLAQNACSKVEGFSCEKVVLASYVQLKSTPTLKPGRLNLEFIESNGFYLKENGLVYSDAGDFVSQPEFESQTSFDDQHDNELNNLVKNLDNRDFVVTKIGKKAVWSKDPKAQYGLCSFAVTLKNQSNNPAVVKYFKKYNNGSSIVNTNCSCVLATEAECK